MTTLCQQPKPLFINSLISAQIALSGVDQTLVMEMRGLKIGVSGRLVNS